MALFSSGLLGFYRSVSAICVIYAVWQCRLAPSKRVAAGSCLPASAGAKSDIGRSVDNSNGGKKARSHSK